MTREQTRTILVNWLLNLAIRATWPWSQHCLEQPFCSGDRGILGEAVEMIEMNDKIMRPLYKPGATLVIIVFNYN